MTECYLFAEAGLGNQLFQIAAAYAHCQRHNLTLCICDKGKKKYWDTILGNFKNNITLVESSTIPWEKEPHHHYTPIPKEYHYLRGWYQSGKYFKDYEQNLRNLFEIQNTQMNKHNLSTEGIALHVRRGDYQDPFFRGLFDVCTPSYWQRAIALCQQKYPEAPVYVFSDDIEWCRRHIHATHIEFIDEPDELVTLCLMSRMRRFVISNSSFSWWCVWFSKKQDIVIAPSRWFNHTTYDYDDMYEASWIRLNPDLL